MSKRSGNRPLEIFGYPAWNHSSVAQDTRRQYWCPFQETQCDKKSRLLNYPFGACSAEHGGRFRIICPHRFEERGSIQGIPKVLEDITLHYFGDSHNTIIFREVNLPNVGTIDYVLVRHKPMRPEVDDFVSVEFQSDSATGTGALVSGVQDFFQGLDIENESYKFGINTYDSIKRSITQLMNKGIVYESWNTNCYWVIQEYIYANLASRYGFKTEGFSSTHASRFALYDIVPDGDLLSLEFVRFISTSVDEVFQAMRNNPGIPSKDDFVDRLNSKLRLKLSLQAR